MALHIEKVWNDDDRWPELRAHVEESKINHLFYSYLRKPTPQPIEPENFKDFELRQKTRDGYRYRWVPVDEDSRTPWSNHITPFPRGQCFVLQCEMFLRKALLKINRYVSLRQIEVCLEARFVPDCFIWQMMKLAIRKTNSQNRWQPRKVGILCARFLEDG